MTDARPPNQPNKIQDTESQLIKTRRLILREAREFDLGAFHELYSNKDVMRYWSDPHNSVSTTKFYLKNMFTSSSNGRLAFVLVLPLSDSTIDPSPGPVLTKMDEGKVIGHAGIWHSQSNELVYMIGPTYWRQGFMTETLSALIPIFWEKGLKMIFADVDPENEASVRLLKSLGFKQGGENIVASYTGCPVRMELSNPNGGSEEEEEEEGIGKGKGKEEEIEEAKEEVKGGRKVDSG